MVTKSSVPDNLISNYALLMKIKALILVFSNIFNKHSLYSKQLSSTICAHKVCYKDLSFSGTVGHFIVCGTTGTLG